MAALQSFSKNNNILNNLRQSRLSRLFTHLPKLSAVRPSIPSRQAISDTTVSYLRGARDIVVENFDFLENVTTEASQKIAQKTSAKRQKLENSAWVFHFSLQQVKAKLMGDNDARRVAAFKTAMAAFSVKPDNKRANDLGYWMEQMAKDSFTEFQSGAKFLCLMKAQAPEQAARALDVAQAGVAAKNDPRAKLLVDFAQGQYESMGEPSVSAKFVSAAVELLGTNSISKDRFNEVLENMPNDGVYRKLSTQAKAQGYKTLAFEMSVEGALANVDVQNKESVGKSAIVLATAMLDGSLETDLKKKSPAVVMDNAQFDKLLKRIQKISPALYQETLLNIRDLSGLEKYGQANAYIGAVANFEYRLARFEQNPTKEYPWMAMGLVEANIKGVLNQKNTQRALDVINSQSDMVRAKMNEQLKKYAALKIENSLVRKNFENKMSGIRAVSAPKKVVDWSRLGKEEILEAIRANRKSVQSSQNKIIPMDAQQESAVTPKAEASAQVTPVAAIQTAQKPSAHPAQPKVAQEVSSEPVNKDNFFEKLNNGQLENPVGALFVLEQEEQEGSFLLNHVNEFAEYRKSNLEGYENLMAQTHEFMGSCALESKADAYEYVIAQGKFAKDVTNTVAAVEYGKAAAKLANAPGHGNGWLKAEMAEVKAQCSSEVAQAMKLGVGLSMYQQDELNAKERGVKMVESVFKKRQAFTGRRIFKGLDSVESKRHAMDALSVLCTEGKISQPSANAVAKRIFKNLGTTDSVELAKSLSPVNTRFVKALKAGLYQGRGGVLRKGMASAAYGKVSGFVCGVLNIRNDRAISEAQISNLSS